MSEFVRKNDGAEADYDDKYIAGRADVSGNEINGCRDCDRQEEDP